MKAIPHWKPVIVFAGFLWASTITCMGPDQTPTSPKPDAATPPQSEVQKAQDTPKNKPLPSGVWHHFGERNVPIGVGQSHPGVSDPIAPHHGSSGVVPVETAPREEFGTKRLADLERQMWALVNRDRLDPATFAETQGRAQPLRWNERLAAVARTHSRDMFEQRFFAHVDREGRTVSARVNEAGIPWRVVGENIAIHRTVPGAEKAFMNEPRFQENHRSNVLNTNYTDVGIGIVQGSNGSFYITQDFVATPPNRSWR